jgi:hypothetical protein
MAAITADTIHLAVVTELMDIAAVATPTRAVTPAVCGEVMRRVRAASPAAAPVADSVAAVVAADAVNS